MERVAIFPLALALFVIGARPADATVHNTIASFAAINANQHPPVAVERSAIGNMFDNNLESMYSLGLGGSIEFEVSPTTETISSGNSAEITYLGGVDQEAVKVYLGSNLDSYVYIGMLLNDNYPGGPGAVTANSAVATISGYGAGENTIYSFTVNSGSYNSIKFVDVSFPSTSTDGFDIAEFSVTTNSVPEPASLMLLGGGLLVIGVVRGKRG